MKPWDSDSHHIWSQELRHSECGFGLLTTVDGLQLKPPNRTKTSLEFDLFVKGLVICHRTRTKLIPFIININITEQEAI